MNEDHMNTFVTVSIEHLDNRGLGLARHADTQIAIPFTLPGETAQVEIIHPKRREPWGKLETLLTPSSKRIPPTCSHFGQCGGCLLQHLSEETYQEFKTKNLQSTLQNHGLPTNIPGEVFFLGANQRRRIDISGRMTSDGLVLGFHNINSKRPFTVTQCPVLHPKIEALFKPLHTLLESLLIEKEKIHVFFTLADNGIDLMLAGLKRQFEEMDVQRLISFAKTHDLVRLVFKAKKRHILYEKEKPIVYFGGFPVEIASNAFLQASQKADHVLAEIVVNNIPHHTQRIADLFCGRGTLSLPMVKAGFEVDGYECDDHALDALTKAGAPRLQVHSRNLFESPLTSSELTKYDLVVLDPPRSGIKQQSIALCDSNIQRIIYVSCGPDSFARDGAILQDNGYKLNQLHLVDQFIWTPHLEIVGIFDRT